jgi:TonB family protein
MDDLKNDIEKYLKGELPEAKMHALEKRALDDPFLADALEGASGVEGHEFARDMALLGHQLTGRLDQKKVIPLWIWPARIAAGLLVIAAATYVIIRIQAPQKDQENLALTIEEKTPEPAGTTDSLRDSTSEEYLSMNDADEAGKAEAESTPPPAPKLQGEIAPAKPKPATPAEVLAEKAGEPIVQEEIHRDETAEAQPRSEEEVRKDISPEVAREAPSVASASPAQGQDVNAKMRTKAGRAADSDAKRETSVSSGYYAIKQDSVATVTDKFSSQVVTGRVTSTDDGSPLPGVNVMIKGSSTGTVTDIRGNYQLPVSDLKTTLVFSFIGMESKEVSVNTDPIMNVTLSPDVAQLSEVVVVGYGEGKEEEDKAFPTFDMAEPAGGKRAFKKYLEDKMIYPQEALDNKVEGRVTIQFTIETSGQVSDFNVIKGIGYGCDDELIRLIKEGPRWSPMKRDDEPVKGRVRVRMRFTLPKKK